MDFNKSDEMLEEFAVDDTGAFGRIRNTLRAKGDMFLFGKPTPDILHIMIKLYHENIVKNLSLLDAKYMSPIARGVLSGKRDQNLQFMCGIIQMKDGQIYITISEAPKLEINDKERVEDELFEKKQKFLDKLLKSCNIEVEYPEQDNSNINISKMAITTFRKFSDARYKIGWRAPGVRKNTFADGVLNPEFYEKLSTHLIIDEPPKESKSMNYNNELWNKKYTVNMVNSYKYLQKRLENGTSFAPFKKYKYDEPSPAIECNNGSTCTESKLFSYVYNDLGKEFTDISGFAVFWVGKELPPKHHIKGYCYSPDIPAENIKLERLRDDCLKIIMDGENKKGESKNGESKEGESEKGESKLAYVNDKKFKDVLKHVVQPIAMACPGCYSNYLKYTTGNMGTKWDQEGCYLEVSPRTARAAKRAAAKGATTAAKGATTTAKGATATAKATAAKAAKGGGEPTTTLKPMTNDEAYAAAENNVYGNTFLNWGANERASVKKLRALRAQSKKTKHKGGNRTHKRKNQKRRSTRRLKRHHKI